MVHVHSIDALPAPERRRKLGNDGLYYGANVRNGVLIADAERAQSVHADSAVNDAADTAVNIEQNRCLQN